MKMQTVHTRYTAHGLAKVIKFSDRFGADRFKVYFGSRYVGKVTDGGYTTKSAAMRYAESII